MVKKKPQKNTITLEINGPKITADKFSRSIRMFFDLINDVALDVSGNKKAIEWLVSVKPGSVIICATPESINGSPDIVSKTVKAIGEGISAINKSPKLPNHFSENSLKKIYDLASMSGVGDTGLDYVRIKVNRKCNVLSLQSAANVEQLLGTVTKAYGSVEGKLQVLSVRNRLDFSVYDSLTDKPVKCYFSDDTYDKVITAIGKRVSVYGLIRYKKSGEPTSVEIEKLEIFPQEKELPSANEVLGILKN